MLWVEAAQISVSTAVKHGDPGQVEVDTYRCVDCGYLELYAGMGSKTPGTSSQTGGAPRP